MENPNRRRFLRSTVRFFAGTAAFGLFAWKAGADPRPVKLSEDDFLAKRLHYHEDISQVDLSAHKKGQICARCEHYSGQAGDPWGPCQIFNGELVAAKGWCTAYTPAS